MPDLKLNDSHDLMFVDGDLVLTKTESESLAQRLKIKLLSFEGDWFLNLNEGIPYHQKIFLKQTPKATIDLIFKRAILEEEDVLALLEFSSTIDARYRIYSLNFKIRSANGVETIPVELSF